MWERYIDLHKFPQKTWLKMQTLERSNCLFLKVPTIFIYHRMQGKSKWVKLCEVNIIFFLILSFNLVLAWWMRKLAVTNYVIQLNEYQTENKCQKCAFFPREKMTKFLPGIYFWNNLILHTKSYSIFPDKLQIVSGWTNACEQRNYLSILLRYIYIFDFQILNYM